MTADTLLWSNGTSFAPLSCCLRCPRARHLRAGHPPTHDILSRGQELSCRNVIAHRSCSRLTAWGPGIHKLLLSLGLRGLHPAECGVFQRLSLSCSSSAASSLGPAARQLLLGVVPDGLRQHPSTTGNTLAERSRPDTTLAPRPC